MFNLDAITNKNKNDDKNWPYRMLIGPSGSGKTNALLNLIQKKKIATLLIRFICMLKI